jgi:hypothetical protein
MPFDPQYLYDCLAWTDEPGIVSTSMPAVTPTGASGSNVVPFVLPATFDGAKPAEALADVNAGDVASGIKRLVKLGNVTPECGFLADAVKRRGADHTRNTWLIVGSMSVHLENGLAEYRTMADKHPDYGDGSETEATFIAKQKEGYGWPSCAAIHKHDVRKFDDAGQPTADVAGKTLCERCAHKDEGKSPFNFERFPNSAGGGSGGSVPPPLSIPLRPAESGAYDPDDALAMGNANFFMDDGGTVNALTEDKLPRPMKMGNFQALVANIFVESIEPNKPAKPFSDWWVKHPRRPTWKKVFKPRNDHNPKTEFNLWLGWGVEAKKGWALQRRFLRHLRESTCRNPDDRTQGWERRAEQKFKDLLRWCAWAVQHPEQRADVVVVLKSPLEGTGKSTVGNVMATIFGTHGTIMDKSEDLLGKFNAQLERLHESAHGTKRPTSAVQQFVRIPR